MRKMLYNTEEPLTFTEAVGNYRLSFIFFNFSPCIKRGVPQTNFSI